jgi:Cap4 dsDNA endonuclease
MQKDLLEALIDKPQRETVGSDTSSRFDYQKNWAFCEMLRRHMANADYLVAFEFHDDAVFLSPNSAPTTAEFCQVKTSKSANARKLADSFLARNTQIRSSVRCS